MAHKLLNIFIGIILYAGLFIFCLIMSSLLLPYFSVLFGWLGEVFKWIFYPFNLLVAALIYYRLHNKKIFRIVGSIWGIISLLFILAIFESATGILNPIWSSIDCGGIDPGFTSGCTSNLYGKKKSCFLFKCKIEKSEIPSYIPTSRQRIDYK